MENILWNTWQYLVDVFDCFLILYLFRKMMRTRLRQPKYYYLFLPVLAAVLFACNCWLSGMIGLGVMTCVYAAFSLLLFRGTVMMRLFWPAFCSVLFFSIDFIYSSALLMFFRRSTRILIFRNSRHSSWSIRLPRGCSLPRPWCLSHARRSVSCFPGGIGCCLCSSQR